MEPRFKFLVSLSVVVLCAGVCLFFARPAEAHCDTLDGPVVNAAKASLEKGDVKPALRWVRKKDEEKIRNAFKKTLTVRKIGPEAKYLADMYFFETLVRIHREGEGAPYTGLKPAGDIEPIIALTDKALESGSADELLNNITKYAREGIQKRFKEAIERKKHAGESVETGREYVEAYVKFIHYVERLHNDISGKTGNDDESGESEHAH